MNVQTLHAGGSLPTRVEMVPKYFVTDLVITPPDNPVYTAAMLADLLASIREHKQLVPGWVAPSPDLEADQRLCLEGNRRLQVCRQLGLPFWAFDLGRVVPEEERIVLTFNHNSTRRVMSRSEIAERAARFIELTNCTAGEAAKLLCVSPATLSKAFGERRIPPELRARAERFGQSIRSLIAAAPPAVMLDAIIFAETPGADGKPPTRDEVAAHIADLKQKTSGNTARPKTVTLRFNDRNVTFSVKEGDSVASVTKDLASLIAELKKHPDVHPDGWPFLFA